MFSQPYRVPKSWEWVQLTEIVQELESGGRPKGGVRGIESGIPSIGGEHLADDGGFDFSTMRFVPPKFAQSMRRGRVRTNDILIVKDGATTGKTSYVYDGFPFDNAVLNEHVFRVRVFPEVANQRYIFHFLRSRYGQSMINDSFKGSAQGGINQSFLNYVYAPLSPLPEQERIVSKLENLLQESRTARKSLQKVPSVMKRFRQSVLSKAFGGELTERDPNDEPADELLERIRQERRRKWEEGLRVKGKDPRKYKYVEPVQANTSSLSELPKGWRLASLEQIAFVERGRFSHRPRNEPRFYGGNYPFIQTGDIANSGGRIQKFRQTLNEKGLAISKMFKRGTIMIAIAANIGDSAILEFDACATDSVVGISCVDPIQSEYVEFYLRTKKSDLESFAPATAQKNINLRILNPLPVPIPSVAEQKRIVQRINEAFAMADSIQSNVQISSERLNTLAKSILAKAFKGKLVPQDPKDEPASVLLEQIRVSRAKPIEMRGKRRRLPAEDSKCSRYGGSESIC